DFERDVALGPGESAELAGYRWELVAVEPRTGPNYQADQGQVLVYEGDQLLARLYPEKRLYASQPNNPMTESAVDVGLLRDLYVSLGEPLGADRWSLRVYYKPLIRWVWGGSVLMALGGFIALTDRRYYRRRSAAGVEAVARA
ncbi:MAG: cytochrome c-type biogenesis CcmF C-terminal domain-containing protein, partial [Oceanococcaceae bacterium]